MKGGAMEQWKQSCIFPERYDVSNMGRVRSRISRHGEKRLLVLKTFVIKSGYEVVILKHDGKKATTLVHRLVLNTFKRAPRPNEEADHINRSRADNRLENLRWLSLKKNRDRRICAYGENHGRAKLSAEQILALRKLLGKIPQSKIASMFMVSQAQVSRIKLNQRWQK